MSLFESRLFLRDVVESILSEGEKAKLNTVVYLGLSHEKAGWKKSDLKDLMRIADKYGEVSFADKSESDVLGPDGRYVYLGPLLKVITTERKAKKMERECRTGMNNFVVYKMRTDHQM